MLFPHENMRFQASLSKKVLTSWWTGKQAPRPGADGSNRRFEPSAVSPRAKPENPKGFQPPYHPHQFLLKSKRFPGAKTARKRFLLWKMRFSDAKIAPCPPYTPPGTIESSKGLRPSRALRSFLTVRAPGRRTSRRFRVCFSKRVVPMSPAVQPPQPPAATAPLSGEPCAPFGAGRTAPAASPLSFLRTRPHSGNRISPSSFPDPRFIRGTAFLHPIRLVDHSVFRERSGEGQRASCGLTCFAYELHFSWLRGSKWVRALPGQKGRLSNVPPRQPFSTAVMLGELRRARSG